MKSKNIRFLIILASMALIGISISQVYWVRKAFRQESDHFHREVNSALNYVADEFYNYLDVTKPAFSPIRQLTGKYYVVRIDGPIDANMLDNLLRNAFSQRNITADFEYGIYDCETQGMVFDKFVSGQDLKLNQQLNNLPVWDETNYYFGLYFPGKERYILGQMGIWGFTTMVMVVVLVFFGYGLFVILKQKRLSEIQKDFINNMTHEFRTPISTIEVASSVLAQPSIKDDPKRYNNYVEIISKENMRLKNQVDRVLQLASLENDHMLLKKEAIDLHVLCHEAVQHIKKVNPEAEIHIDLKAENSQIIGDYLHVTNAIYNLVDNGMKYSSTPTVEIQTHNTGESIILSVKDRGMGISKKNLKYIFKKFYRVNTGNRHDVKGFGIGLSYVKEVMNGLDGQIEIESELGMGSEVKLIFKNV